jgi:hypothetical protein
MLARSGVTGSPAAIISELCAMYPLVKSSMAQIQNAACLRKAATSGP